MSLGDKIEKLKFDTRMVDINLKSGNLKKSQLDDHKGSLPDVGNNAVKLDFKHEIGPQTREENH